MLYMEELQKNKIREYYKQKSRKNKIDNNYRQISHNNNIRANYNFMVNNNPISRILQNLAKRINRELKRLKIY